MGDNKTILSSQLEDIIIQVYINYYQCKTNNLQQYLMQEAMLEDNDKTMWIVLLNILVVEYMSRLGDRQPPPVVKLALAVIFVGTEDRELFPMAFKLLRHVY